MTRRSRGAGLSLTAPVADLCKRVINGSVLTRFQAKGERIIGEELQGLKWSERDLRQRPKSAAAKLNLAARLRRETTLTIRQLAERLHLGSWKSLNNKLYLRRRGKGKRNRKLWFWTPFPFWLPLGFVYGLAVGIPALTEGELDFSGRWFFGAVSVHVFGLAALWLLSDYLGGRHRFLTFLGMFFCILVFSLMASWAKADFADEFYDTEF